MPFMKYNVKTLFSLSSARSKQKGPSIIYLFLEGGGASLDFTVKSYKSKELISFANNTKGNYTITFNLHISFSMLNRLQQFIIFHVFVCILSFLLHCIYITFSDFSLECIFQYRISFFFFSSCIAFQSDFRYTPVCNGQK